MMFMLVEGSAAAGGQPQTFRVMTFNIQHGRGLDNVVDLERTASVILQERADVAGLQEVDRGVRRTDRRDLPAELEQLTGMSVFFAKNHPHQGGEYGNAFLTRFPFRDAGNLHLPMVGTTEQRGVQQMVVSVHGVDVLFLNTHIANARVGEPERQASVAEFERILAENQVGPALPVIFLGDFNAVPGTSVYKRMAALLADTWVQAGEGDGATVPVREPQRRIDYIWVSRDAPFKAVRAWVPRTEASDHLPIVVEFVMQPTLGAK
jgi:endonuclease/exonuclease/phosphatase family metal-dependent hydrolase